MSLPRRDLRLRGLDSAQVGLTTILADASIQDSANRMEHEATVSQAGALGRGGRALNRDTSLDSSLVTEGVTERQKPGTYAGRKYRAFLESRG